MSENYKRLNLPKNILRETFIPELNGNDFWHIYQDIESVLNDEIINIFKTLSVVPNMVILFGANLTNRKLNQIMVHSDLYYKNNEWVDAPFGINYELGKTTTTIYWFDTNKCKYEQPMPAQFYQYPSNIFNGKVYHKKLTDPYPINAQIIESVTITNEENPILFRTDVAHGVSYITETSPRFMLSIRFDVDIIKNWEQALDVFSNIIV